MTTLDDIISGDDIIVDIIETEEDIDSDVDVAIVESVGDWEDDIVEDEVKASDVVGAMEVDDDSVVLRESVVMLESVTEIEELLDIDVIEEELLGDNVSDVEVVPTTDVEDSNEELGTWEVVDAGVVEELLGTSEAVADVIDVEET